MQVAPSILNADFSCLQSEINSLAAADRIHLDIMDFRYVPNMSFGASILGKVNFKIPTEVHLMTENPENYFTSFLGLGSSGITFHIENTGQEKALQLLKFLKQKDAKAGICIDGFTSPDFLSDEILNIADQVLVMSVKAGFGGQAFMPESLDKIKNLRKRGFTGEIEVDGGVNLQNVKEIKKAGADVVVVGSFLMKQAPAERESVIKAFQAGK
jgi:ribulose-phosphate 3-epimerase